MAQKRKAQEAFGRDTGQLSAFAAARLGRKQSSNPVRLDASLSDTGGEAQLTAIEVAQEPYDVEDVREANEGSVQQDSRDLLDVDTLKPPTPTTKLSNFRKASIQHNDSNHIDLILRSGESITALGEYDIQVIEGIASIYGAVLRSHNGTHRVFAPSTHALPQAVARQDETFMRLSTTTLNPQPLASLSPHFRNISAFDSPHGRSFDILHTTRSDPLKRSLEALEIDSATQKILNRLSADAEAPLRIITVGAKSSGKSTFNRLLCNSLLFKSASASASASPALRYLDIDPGQPEFGPPGLISLVEVTASVLGPPFTHPASRQYPQYRLLRSHPIAAASFKDDPEHCLACVQDLLQHAGHKHALIINPCGWVTGLGASILLSIIQSSNLTDVVVMEPVDVELLQTISSPSSNQHRAPAIHRLPRRTPKPAPRSPAEMRTMQMISYFHHRPARETIERSIWSGKPLSQVKPWIVSYAGDEAVISAICSYGQSPRPDFLAEVLDGAFVAIVTTTSSARFLEDAIAAEDGEVDLNADQSSSHAVGALRVSRTMAEHLPYLSSSTDGSISPGFPPPLDPQHSECHGLALIRGIDSANKQLHLISPLSESQLAALWEQHKGAVVLVRGAFEDAGWAYLEELHKADYGGGPAKEEEFTDEDVDVHERPWVSTGTGKVGVEGAVWRLRFPPLASSAGASGGKR